MPDFALNLTRTLAAPPERVWALWADPVHRLGWWAPSGTRCAEFTHDFTEGGNWQARLEPETPGTAPTFWMGGSYTRVAPLRLLAFTFAWLEHGTTPGDRSTITVTLAAEGDRTRQTFHQAPFANAHVRDRHAKGWGQCLDRMPAALEGG